MESSISQDEIQKWIINKRKEIANEGWRKGIEKDKYVWTSSLLSSLEDWVWNQPKKLTDNNESSFKVLRVNEYLRYLKLKENSEELTEKEQFLLKCAEILKSESDYYAQLYYDLNKDLRAIRNRLGLNTNCVYCEEFSHCNKWHTSTPCPNYKKKETVELDKELFEEVLHELTITHNLYCTDNVEKYDIDKWKCSGVWQLDYDDLIKKLKKVDE